MNKPRLFIGSTKERLGVARLIQEQLEADALGMVWDKGIFGLTRPALASLLRALDMCEAALFVLTPDDVATIRGHLSSVTRDNVLFELGLFMGRLGPARTFMLAPEKMDDFHLPTDLLGTVLDPYDATATDTELLHALGPAANRVRRALREVSGPTPSPTLLNFLETIDFSKVTDICVIGYTGSTTVRTICEYLERDTSAVNQDITLRVALRSQLLSDSQRAQDTRRSVELLEQLSRKKLWVQPEVRYYGAPALLRSVLITQNDGTQLAYLSYYDWNRPGTSGRRTTSNDRSSHQLTDITSRKLLPVHQSWFSHYWANHKIHTILFDFDDTLFSTTSSRVRAWVDTIREAQSRAVARSDFTLEVRDSLVAPELLNRKMEEIFFVEQSDARIADRVFSNAHSAKLSWVRDYRTRRRAELTEQLAKPMPNLASCLKRLSQEYQLGIVTGTSELPIKRLLKQHGLTDYFTFIFGREAPQQSWGAVEAKTQNLLRIATLSGIPLDRIVFIGDDDADHKSALQLGMHFIENRRNALDHNCKTLLRGNLGDRHLFITGFDDDEISAALKSITESLDWHHVDGQPES